MPHDLSIFKDESLNKILQHGKLSKNEESVFLDLKGHVKNVTKYYLNEIKKADVSAPLKQTYIKGFEAFYHAVLNILDEADNAKKAGHYHRYLWSYDRLNMGSAGAYTRLDTATEAILMASFITFSLGITLLVTLTAPISLPISVGLIGISIACMAAFGSYYCFDQFPREWTNRAEEAYFFKDLINTDFNMKDLESINPEDSPLTIQNA